MNVTITTANADSADDCEVVEISDVENSSLAVEALPKKKKKIMSIEKRTRRRWNILLEGVLPLQRALSPPERGKGRGRRRWRRGSCSAPYHKRGERWPRASGRGLRRPVPGARAPEGGGGPPRRGRGLKGPLRGSWARGAPRRAGGRGRRWPPARRMSWYAVALNFVYTYWFLLFAVCMAEEGEVGVDGTAGQEPDQHTLSMLTQLSMYTF
ncbi:uncharacterized protein [Dysidea avara]|uniref:uncharacterized protein n=1 Tax=Dysidea avara TaxID=196820 RepID=UPI00331F74AB